MSRSWNFAPVPSTRSRASARAALRVRRDCSKTPVATGLPAPTSVAIGPDGNAYVSIFGPSVGIGEVIRIDLGTGGDDGEEGDH